MPAKNWIFLSPEGKKHTFTNLHKFFRDRGLSPGSFYAVAYGEKKSCLGWTCLKSPKKIPRTAVSDPPPKARPLDIMEQQEIYLMGRAGVQLDRIALKFNLPVRSVGAVMARDPREEYFPRHKK